MRFEFIRLRFDFLARESLFFGPGMAGNILRGTLGNNLRKLACVPGCRDARTCGVRGSCLSARIFEPAALKPGPSGLTDWPRPFLLRARHLNGKHVRPGEAFHFDVHIFSLEPPILSHLVLAFEAISEEGLGPRRGRADLREVRSLPVSLVGGQQEQVIYEGSGFLTSAIRPVALELDPGETLVNKLRVEFLSPTELKDRQRIAPRPEFPILFGRIRDRVSTLRALYGPGALDCDFKGSNARASAIRMTHCDLQVVDAERRSSRTGQTHSIGGFTGTAEYEGDLSEFFPLIRAAEWTGVGRQAVWGKGEIRIRTDFV